MKQTTDKAELLKMLNEKEALLKKKVKRNYDDAKKHLRLAVVKDGMAQDVLYLAAKTFCEVYEMLDELDGVENKLLNGEIEQIANGELSIPDFFAKQMSKKQVRKASDNFFEELDKTEKNRECVCGNCHPEKLEEALKKMGIDIHDANVSIRESFEDDGEDGEIRFQAEVKKIRPMADTPDIVYVDAWKGPGWDGDDIITEVKECVKDVHPGVAVLVKVVKDKLW